MTSPSPLLVLQARAEARAMLYAVGELSLQDAVDGCQQAAEAYGLVAEVGQDKVQEIIAEAFAAVRATDMVPDPIENWEQVGRAAESTIAAAEYLFKQNDPKRWAEWLAKHSEAEQADILKRIERRRQA